MSRDRSATFSCRPLCVALLAAAIGGVCGCHDKWVEGRPKTVPATGVVTYNGKPVAGAVVTFMNDEAARSASGRTDAAGRFSLMTFVEGDGAVPGSQQVSVFRFDLDYPGTKLVGLTREQLNAELDKMSKEEILRLPPVQGRWLIPEKYGATATSGLTAEVVDGGENHFVFDLRD